MATITMTDTTDAVERVPAAVTTAARFAGHFVAALVSVVLLGRDLEH